MLLLNLLLALSLTVGSLVVFHLGHHIWVHANTANLYALPNSKCQSFKLLYLFNTKHWYYQLSYFDNEMKNKALLLITKTTTTTLDLKGIILFQIYLLLLEVYNIGELLLKIKVCLLCLILYLTVQLIIPINLLQVSLPIFLQKGLSNWGSQYCLQK